MRLGLVVAVCGLSLLAGCSGGSINEVSQTEATQTTSSSPGAMLTGSVYGGQQAISGAHVYLFAANTTGYGNASVSLLNAAATGQSDSVGAYVLSGSTGGFLITGDYTCTAGTQVYAYALGGSAGSGANSAAGLMAVLGNCPGGTSAFLTATPFIAMNEVSTVAAAYAMAGFATDATHVSSSSTGLAATGVKNAFATASNMETLSTGVALATTPAANGGNGTVPQSEINTLGNILAACVNSNGAVTGPTNPTACYTLFTNALSAGSTGTQPTDTATAAINIAHNPGSKVAALFGLGTGTPPFAPALGAAPNDYTIAISYTGSGLNNPAGIAIDAAGDVWVANSGDDNGATVSELTPLGGAHPGSPFSGGGLNVPAGIAIDSTGDVWIGNDGPQNSPVGTITELAANGSVISTAAYTGGGLNVPDQLAFDAAGHLWVADTGSTDTISEFGSTGTAVSSTGYPDAVLVNPSGLAIDISGNVWADSINASTISKLSSTGSTAADPSGYSGGGLSETAGIAIDSTGNVWIANGDTNALSEFSSAGAVISTTPYSGGGLNGPDAIVIDGSNNIWAANENTTSISEFNSSGAAISGANGFEGGSLAAPAILVVDGSGNVWVGNPAPANTMVEFVGAATPLVTPVVANLLTPYGSHAVNKP